MLLLDNMISPANMSQNHSQQPISKGNNHLPQIFEDQNIDIPQRPRQKARSQSQRSNISMYSATSSSNRPPGLEYKAPSNMSLFSDLTDTSYAKRESLNLRDSRYTKTKSDTSMGTSDNLSDLSEVLGSLEMR